MSDKILKDIWNKEKITGAAGYESETIERFISGRSSSVADKVRKMIHMDIALKFLFSLIFFIDAILYFNIQTVVSYVCLTGIAMAIPLILFEFTVIKQFNQISDYGQSTKEKLAKMLTFLRSRFFTALLSISSSYVFLFISGSLVYFFVTYGELRRLDNMDIFVFTTFILIGVVINFATNYAQVKYHIKHLESCLSDLNDNVLFIVLQNIETQQKQDQTTKLLLGMVLIIGFVLLIAILKKIGM